MKEVVYFKSGYASPDLTGAKSHQKMVASMNDTKLCVYVMNRRNEWVIKCDCEEMIYPN